VQSASQEEYSSYIDAYEIVNHDMQQLLEYRFVFGQFFHELIKSYESGEKMRQEFIFVDQYFDAIETHLFELKNQPRLIKEEE